jgi:hypothetical protein
MSRNSEIRLEHNLKLIGRNDLGDLYVLEYAGQQPLN